jgi:SAM-dependent methyltransferase
MADSLAHSWNRLMKWRSECFKRFGAVQGFRIVSPQEEITAFLRPDSRVLDIGAGAHKPLEKSIKAITPFYYCLDTDPDGVFDFRSFSDMPDDLAFDLVLANQVLEHLEVPDAVNVTSMTFSRLAENGRFIATVPNAAHPVRQRDISHVTPWVANDLYSLLKHVGFEIENVARYNKFPLTDDPLKRWIVETVCQEFRVDWCDSIMVTGIKPVGSPTMLRDK